MIARAVQRLPVAPAEVAVAAFAVCSIVAWISQWHISKDPGSSIMLATYEEDCVPHDIQMFVARYRVGWKGALSKVTQSDSRPK